MPANLVPSDPNNGLPAQYQPGGAAWGQGPSAPQESSMGELVARVSAALRRYEWLILAVVTVGSSAGFALTRLVDPKFTVNGSVIIKRATVGTGPIAAPGLINDPASWADLSRSFMVLDQVVQRLGLYVKAANLEDSSLVKDLRPSALLRPGKYELRIDPSGARYRLFRPPLRAGEQETLVESGAVGDSVGRSVGFLWQPEAGRFKPGSNTAFTVITPRDAAVQLSSELVVAPMGPQTNLMRLNMSGDEPRLLAAKMNTLLDQFVTEATRLSRENLTTIRATVEEQMIEADKRLKSAEGSLESYKINTITLPNENTVVSPGVAISTSPVFAKFFADNVSYKTVALNRQALAAIVNAAGPNSAISYEGLKALPPRGPSDPLEKEIMNLELRQAELRKLQETFTDEFKPVKDKKEEIRVLETQTIPLLARQTLEQLEIQESELKRQIEGQATELKRIPERTIEEARRQREVFI